MKIKALITTLAILGTSSVAMARPVTASVSAHASWSFGARPTVVRDRRAPRAVVIDPVRVQRPIYTDNNRLTDGASVYQGTYPAMNLQSSLQGEYLPARNAWVAITEPTRIDNGRQFISDLPNLGRFNALRLQNVTGASSIQQVYIQFQNGQEQIVKLDKCLDRFRSTIDINLTGESRQLKRVIVYGSTDRGSAYQLLAL